MPHRLLLLGLVLLLVLGACGDDVAAPVSGGGAWSDPPALGDGVRSEREVLAALHAHLMDGASMDMEAWSADARSVAEALWPVEPDQAPSPDAQVHLDLSLVAGEVARWLGASPSARAERTRQNPIDVEIHDAYIDAIVTGPTRYRVWVAGAGAALLGRLRDERRRRFFGDD